MDDHLIQHLSLAETGFLDALQSGPQMLASYCQTLAALPDIMSAAMKAGNVGTETLSLAHSVASRISKIASCFLDIKRREELAIAQLQQDCDVVLHQMASLSLSAEPKSSFQNEVFGTSRSPTHSRMPTPNVASSSPPFLGSAHQWLLDNLHNPYPPAEVKARIAAASSCQVSSINSWFINARRRIGWTALCRERFSNCRADMIDAAYRALVEEDPQRTLPPGLRHSFVAMKAEAEGLFLSTLTRSAFADLDAMVRDMPVEDTEFVGVRKYSKGDKVGPAKGIRDSYPSPDPSTSASPVPATSDSFTDESEEEDVTSLSITGSKRRWSSVESVDELSHATKRPIKRLRAVTPQTCLPSPIASTSGIDSSPDVGSPKYSAKQPPRAEITPVLRPRDLLLSDMDATPRHPDDSIATHHPHILSGPLPRSNFENEYSIDDWFNTNFDTLFAIPPPIDANQPDFSAPCEVELFKDYSIPVNPKYMPKHPPTYTDTSTPTDLSDLDSLLQSIAGDTFASTPSNVLSSVVTGARYTVSLDSSVPDTSQRSVDWTSLLNSTDSYQPIAYSSFSQYPTDSQPLLDIDLSMLQLPQVMPAVNCQGDFTSKQAKLHQFHTMQEAMRKMEEELRSEGIVI